MSFYFENVFCDLFPLFFFWGGGQGYGAIDTLPVTCTRYMYIKLCGATPTPPGKFKHSEVASGGF